MVAVFLFWAAAFLLLHTYFFYPAILVALDGVEQAVSNLGFLRDGQDRRVGRPLSPLPTVSVVVAAYNEEGCIHQKLLSSLALEYPPERLEILVGSDGSTDGTEERVRAVADPRVRLFSAPRGGKCSVLNRLIPQARGEIVVLTDANTAIDPFALKMLVRHFDDPQVGAVCGRLRLYNRVRKGYQESVYWAYESFLKLYEGKRGAVMGANGGLYAIRKSLFEPLPEGTIVDDFVMALRLLVQGYRVLYDPEAVAYEETAEDYAKEFTRRVRIAAGNFQSVPWLLPLLAPNRGFMAFAFFSHKLCRWFAPLFLAVVLGANLALCGRPFFKMTLVAQLAFYALAWKGRQRAEGNALLRSSSWAYYFVAMNAALVLGLWRHLRGTQAPAWEQMRA